MKFKSVALASYPRSGNTWMRHLLHEGLGLKSRYALNPETDVVHRAGAIQQVSDEGARIVKTHGCDVENYDAAIHLVRNPIVAISSFWDYCKAFNVPTGPQNKFVETESQGWCRHTMTWRMAAPCGVELETVSVRYEDLYLVPFGSVMRIVTFLGVECDADKIWDAVKHLTLDAMQKRGSKAFFPVGMGRDPSTNLSAENIAIIRRNCEREMKHWRYV